MIALFFGIFVLSSLKLISRVGSLRNATQQHSINMPRSCALRLLVMPFFKSVSPLESVSGIRPM
jgi:hypothetical protein